MTDIDAALARLREMPVHPGLSSIDARVLERVAMSVAGSHPPSSAIFGIAAVAALSLGVASSIMPGMPGKTPPVAPFGTSAALAPSSLLGSGE